MKINVNNFDLDKIEEEFAPIERIVKRKKADDKKKKDKKKSEQNEEGE